VLGQAAENRPLAHGISRPQRRAILDHDMVQDSTTLADNDVAFDHGQRSDSDIVTDDSRRVNNG
jgi:hypothetical protein